MKGKKTKRVQRRRVSWLVRPGRVKLRMGRGGAGGGPCDRRGGGQ